MLEKLQEIYNTVAGRDDLILTPKMKITEMELSSLGLIHLICQIEDTYDIEISNRDMNRFKTVQDVLKYLDRVLERK